jgi:hypothetical protein
MTRVDSNILIYAELEQQDVPRAHWKSHVLIRH